MEITVQEGDWKKRKVELTLTAEEFVYLVAAQAKLSSNQVKEIAKSHLFKDIDDLKTHKLYSQLEDAARGI